jgi:hypothetical protein
MDTKYSHASMKQHHSNPHTKHAKPNQTNHMKVMIAAVAAAAVSFD